MKNKLMEKIAITVGIIFVIAIGVFIFVLKKENDINQGEIILDKIVKTEKVTKKDIEKIEEKTIESEEIEKEKIVDEIADWNTYKNEKYGFEMKYPDSMPIISTKEEVFDGEDRVSLMVHVNDWGKEEKFPLFSVFIWNKNTYQELINSDSYSGVRYQDGTAITFEKEDKVYELSFGGQDAPKIIMDFIKSDDYRKMENSFKSSN